MTPVLAGSLSRFSPVYVLRLLQSSRATGRLEFFRDEERASLWLEDGACLHSRMSGRTVRVGDVLVHQGHLSEPAVELAVAIQQDLPGQRIGDMLVGGGAITEAQLTEALLALQRQLLAGVLLWQRGSFHFLADERVPEGAALAQLGEDGRVEAMLQSIMALADEEQRFAHPDGPEEGEEAA